MIIGNIPIVFLNGPVTRVDHGPNMILDDGGDATLLVILGSRGGKRPVSHSQSHQ